jgi:hypothetical protein
VQARALLPELLLRLDTIRIALPPLRERADFARCARSTLQRIDPAATLTDAAVARHALHRWPGNFRELHAVLPVRCCCTRAPLDVDDLQALLPFRRRAGRGVRAAARRERIGARRGRALRRQASARRRAPRIARTPSPPPASALTRRPARAAPSSPVPWGPPSTRRRGAHFTAAIHSRACRAARCMRRTPGADAQHLARVGVLDDLRVSFVLIDRYSSGASEVLTIWCGYSGPGG